MNYEEVLNTTRNILTYGLAITLSVLLISIGFIANNPIVYWFSILYIALIIIESAIMLLFSIRIKFIASDGMTYDEVFKMDTIIRNIQGGLAERVTILFFIALVLFTIQLEILGVLIGVLGIALALYTAYNKDLYDEFEEINATIEQQYSEEKEND